MFQLSRRLLVLGAVCAASTIFAALPSAAEPLSLAIVHVNDWDRMEESRGAGGAARIAAVVEQERAAAKNAGGQVMVTFGGDMVSPSLLSGFDKGAHMIDLANAIGFDVAVLGNHEFDFGPEVLQQRLSESAFPWLAGNVSSADGKPLPHTAATKIFTYGDYKIGVLGLLTPETSVLSSPGDGIAFASVVEVGARLAGELKDAGADLVIALTHNDAGSDVALLNDVPGIDMVLGGHDHLAFTRYDGRQVVFKSSSQGNYVGVLRLTVDRVESRGKMRLVWTPSFELHHTSMVEPNAAIAEKVAVYQGRLDSELGQPVGETTVELDTRRAAVRGAETLFGNLITDAMRMATGADVAITNGGGIRGDKVYPAGTMLIRKDVLTELPFGNTTVVLKITGAMLKEALEIGVSQVEKTAGRFPQVSGLSFTYDAGKEPGSRVTAVSVGGAPLDMGKSYTVATNDYIAGGGDGYSVFAGAENLLDEASSRLLATQVIDHITSIGKVTSKIEGRIVKAP